MTNARFEPAPDDRGRGVAGRLAMRDAAGMRDLPGIEVDGGGVTMPVPKAVAMIDAGGCVTRRRGVLADGRRAGHARHR